MIGKTILHYNILAKLGEGGMGVVYKAEDTRLERVVALKFLSSHAIAGEEEKKRFKREAKAAAALNHPNICHIYAIDEADDRLFIAMEFIEGKSLAEMVGANGGSPLQIPDAINYATQIAAGLQAAHEKGITHRDIKSANVMVTDKGVVKIMDFGLAKLGNRSMMTKEGTTLGTAAYMSPEQARGEIVDQRSDIWSLGVVLYEMISGRLPFRGEYEQAMIYSILHEEPEPLTALRSNVPIALDGIIAKALAKDAATRYQHVDELPADLKALDTASLTRSRISAASKPFEGLKPSKGYSARFWITAGLLIAATAIALWGWLRPTPSVPKAVMRFAIEPPAEQYFPFTLVPAATISPDGQTLAYISVANDSVFNFHVRNLDSFEETLISRSTTELAAAPFFSPAGKWIGFFGGYGKLKRVGADGGSMQTIADAESVTGADWGEDNTIVYAPSFNSGLFRVSAEGGESEQITQLGGNESSHGWPQFLPGNEFVLFTIEIDGKSFDEAIIAVQSLRTGKRKVVLEGGTFGRYLPTGHLVYARSDALWAVGFDIERLQVTGSPKQVLTNVAFNAGRGASHYAFSDNGTLLYLAGGDVTPRYKLCLVDRRGKSQLITPTQAYYYALDLSPDGDRIAVRIQSANDDIWLIEKERGTSTRLTFKAENGDPVWMPDSNMLIISSDRDGARNLYVMHADGSGAIERLTTSDMTQGATSVSPDGRLLAYDQLSPETGSDIWLLALDDGAEPKPFRVTRFYEGDGSFSPDGRWLAYNSNESGQSEVYVQRVDGTGRKLRVSTGGGALPKWSPDGSKLFYGWGKKLMAVDIRAESEVKVGQPRLLFELPFGDYDPTPGGQHFVMILEGETPKLNRMHVVVNWFEELQQKMREGKR